MGPSPLRKLKFSQVLFCPFSRILPEQYGTHQVKEMNRGRRVAVIYAKGKYFACRHCYDLTYTSCQESDSRYGRFLRNFNFGGGWENMPMFALKGLLSRSRKEEERLEKQMKKKPRGRPRKQK
jgi:hypothetical protein